MSRGCGAPTCPHATALHATCLEGSPSRCEPPPTAPSQGWMGRGETPVDPWLGPGLGDRVRVRVGLGGCGSSSVSVPAIVTRRIKAARASVSRARSAGTSRNTEHFDTTS
eukprot:scaffold17018_cov60-Phaeocystis_antarctica.AAC.1